MPVDREIHFGYPNAKRAFEFAKRVGIDVVDLDANTVVSYDEFMATDDSNRYASYDFDPGTRYDRVLRDAFVNTLDDLGWENGKIVEPKSYADSDEHVGVKSPWGSRIARVWYVKAIYDPVELGDQKANFSIAVNLSGRYCPGILDMDNPHGGLDNSVVLNKEFFDRIDVCKRNLVAAIPELHDAEIFIRNVFY
jgi:hypothetical protein